MMILCMMILCTMTLCTMYDDILDRVTVNFPRACVSLPACLYLSLSLSLSLARARICLASMS